MSQISVAAPSTVEPRRRRGRPRLDDEARRDVHERVVGAAEQLFGERGAAATSIDDVARVAGLSRATVYRLVGGKDDIVLAVTLRRYDEWVDGLLDHLGRRQGAADIVVEAALWTMRSVRKDPSLGALFRGGTALAASGAVGSRGDALHHVTRFSRELARLLEPHIDDLRPGLHPEVVGDRVLGVLLDRLRRASSGAFDARAERAWLDTWLLPAVLAERPPLPPSAGRAPSRPAPSQA